MDLPEPEGPQTTTRSFSRHASCDTSRSTWSAPNHLFTLSSRMIGGASLSARWRTTCSQGRLAHDPIPRSAPAVAVELALQALAVSRHGEAEDEIDERRRMR